METQDCIQCLVARSARRHIRAQDIVGYRKKAHLLHLNIRPCLCIREDTHKRLPRSQQLAIECG